MILHHKAYLIHPHHKLTITHSAGIQTNVPVICTLPVLKMSQMVLYDYVANLEHESKENRTLLFTFDDIDTCFMATQTIRYSQTVTLPTSLHTMDTPTLSSNPLVTSVCAYASGRTIGGSIWYIRCNAADILYTMDINFRKDVVLDGGTLELPPTPSLLIVEGGAAAAIRSVSTMSTSRRKRAGGGAGGGSTTTGSAESLIHTIMDAVRMEGNVIIPVETAGRTLELVHTLGQHWVNHKLFGMYHLVLLSPMGGNVLEFARSQLEWMGMFVIHVILVMYLPWYGF